MAFASALYLGGAALFEYDPDLFGWALAAGAALLPDVDLPTSKLGRVLFWLSTRLEKHFGHRTITHSFLALLVLAVLISPLLWLNPVYFGCILGGCWSHLWIDMLNLRGASLFWPSPLRVVSPKVNTRGRSLGWFLKRLDQQHTYYLSREMQVGSRLAPVANIDLYHPVSFNGKVLRLHYARAQELGPYLNRVAIQGEVYVQFWLKPGDPPVELRIADETPPEVIPEVLRGYL